ncbi:MAG: autotransporter outer membrane beta-barrel domain-containing protein [Rhizobiaceae bacterium]|nr:autotransporter outer membrane beta-barrel domain-containing protein [Rhizobiaceae bacterium]
MRVNGGILALTTGVLLATSGMSLAQNIDTYSAWDGTNFISSFGVLNTATYGQTITPTADQTNLTDFTFYLNLGSGSGVQAQAYIYEWDSAASRITGTALYQSGIFAAPTTATYDPVTLTTGGVTLVPGTTYAVFFTTSNITGQSNSSYRWASVDDTVYSGGQFIYMNNGTNFANLLANTWSSISMDLAFVMNFLVLPTLPDLRSLNANQRQVAQSLLDVLEKGGTLPPAFENLDADDLTRLSGEVSTAAISAGFNSAFAFIDTISDPLVIGQANHTPAIPHGQEPIGYAAISVEPSSAIALAAMGEETLSAADLANEKLAMSGRHAADALSKYGSTRWTIWGSVYGGAQEIDGNSSIGSSDTTAKNWGVASGFDYRIEDARVGLALGGAGSSFSLDNDLGSGRASVFNAGVYGSKTFGNAYISAAAAYAFNNVDTTRSVFGDTLKSDYDAHTLAGRVESGYKLDTTVITLTPYAAVQGASYFLPDYSETSSTGSPYALDYDSQTQSALRTELGARVEHIIAMETGSIKLSGRLAWAWNADTARDVTASFQGLGAPSFTIDGARPDRHALLVDAGAEFGLSENLTAKVSFNGEFSGNVTSYGGAAKLSYKW